MGGGGGAYNRDFTGFGITLLRHIDSALSVLMTQDASDITDHPSSMQDICQTTLVPRVSVPLDQRSGN